MAATRYPEHVKLKAVERDSQVIGEFLDGLASLEGAAIS